MTYQPHPSNPYQIQTSLNNSTMASPRPGTTRKKEPRDVISPKTRDRVKAAKAYI